MAGLELIGVEKKYAAGGGIEGIDLNIGEGERLAIVGPSGAGKSTLLRVVAGLEKQDKGDVRIGGEDVVRRPPAARGLALALQGQPPFPHLNVEENLAFGLRARGVQREERKARVDEVAGGLGLSEFLRRRPGTLSGGEKQRVVLGRTLAVRAKVTLLDEPTTGIDPERREGLLADLIRMHGELGGTWVLVTHDQAEAQAFGDRVAVMRGGRIVQVGEPRSLYLEPIDRFVGRFVGDPGMNLVRCRVEVKEELVTLWGLVPGAGWELPESLGATGSLRERGTGEVELGWRAEEIGEIGDEGAGVGDLALVGRVERTIWRGPRYLIEARVGGHPVRFWSAGGLEAGDRVALRFRLARAYGFDPDTGLKLFGPGTV